MHPQHHHGHTGGDAGEQNIPEHCLGDDDLADDYLGEDRLGDDHLAEDRWIIIGREIRILTCLYSLQGTLSIYTPCNQEVYQEMLFLVADTLPRKGF